MGVLKMTEPFDGTVKPVHVGYYERKYGSEFSPYRDYWDGRHWLYTKNGSKCMFQLRQWRGLAEKP